MVPTVPAFINLIAASLLPPLPVLLAIRSIFTTIPSIVAAAGIVNPKFVHLIYRVVVPSTEAVAFNESSLKAFPGLVHKTVPGAEASLTQLPLAAANRGPAEAACTELGMRGMVLNMDTAYITNMAIGFTLGFFDNSFFAANRRHATALTQDIL